MLTILMVFVFGVASLGVILWFLRGKRAKFRPYVIAGVIIAFLIVSSFSSRSHPVYNSTLLELNNNNKVVELIGSPIKSGISMHSNWTDTYLTMEFPITGPKGNGTVTVYATMKIYKWNLEEIEVKVNGSIYDIKDEIN